MFSIIRKLNLWHCCILLGFPILLILINPNWIFNTFIIDDYIYLGYQIDLPRYVGWNPSDVYYFIDRISWFAPTYAIRQVLSPLLANFVIHLAVYYLATFSIYGILNRLFHARVALITCVLMGQFSLFLRAVGWDYVDGYSLALLSLSACLLTYAATSPRLRWYGIGAGTIGCVMVVAQLFNLFYLPALGIYYLMLNHRSARHHVLNILLWGGIGFISVFIIQTLYYYNLTGRWFIWGNSIAASRDGLSGDDWKNLIIKVYGATISSWHILYLMVAIIAVWIVSLPKRFRAIYEDATPDFTGRLRIVTLFFALCYGVLWAWLFIANNHVFRLSFYSSTIIPSVFIVLGGLFSTRLYRLSERDFQIITVFSITFPIAGFVLFSQIPASLVIPIWLITIILGILFFVFSFTIKRQGNIINWVVALVMLSYVAGIDANNIRIFLRDRLSNQRTYEMVIDAVNFIRARYENYHLESFRFAYYDDDPNLRLLFSLTSIYLHELGDRTMTLSDGWDDLFFESEEVIILSTEKTPESIITDENEALKLACYQLDVQKVITLQQGALSLTMIISQFNPLPNCESS